MQKLTELSYGYDALEPVIDKETMEIHHTKHLQAYITNYNNLIEGTDFVNMSVEEVLKNSSKLDEKIRQGVINNGGGIYNHNLYFSTLKLDTKLTNPQLIAAIDESFGSLDSMIEQLKTAGLTQFGSGWSFLVVDKNKKLAIVKRANQDTPLNEDATAIFGIDVWEHAYYLNYQNRRPDYLTAISSIIDWPSVESRFLDAIK